ncbi:MAG: hypothetical protein ABI559_07420 [Chloroflexota bacterium]
MSHGHRQHPITPMIAERVRDLHHDHKTLGHDGILRLLEDEGIVVDEHELRVFMDEHHLDAGPTGVPYHRGHVRIGGWFG